MKLINKLIRFEEDTVEKINALKERIEKDGEYISFNGLVRKLIMIGLENYGSKN